MTVDTHELVEAAHSLVPELAESSAEIEAGRRVPRALSDRMGRAGFYRMLVPAALGGGEVHPRVFARVLEEIARGDAAAAWVAMTGSTTGLLMAYLEPSAAKGVLDDQPDAALAGVFAPSGKARPDGDGYRLDGRWSYGSGCENARWRMGGALVFEGDAPRMLDSGAPEIRSCFFRDDQSEVVDTWSVSGLRGTGSHDLVVKDVRVPAELTCCVMSDAPRSDAPLYRFPIFGLLATGVASVGTGIARAALDELIQLATSKRSRGGKKTMAEGELVQVTVARAEAELAAARALVRATLDEVYEHAAAGNALTDSHRARLRMAATHAATVAARVTAEAYTLAGGAAIWERSPLQRHFRDVHVMTQHIMVGAQTMKPVGRILMGLPTDTAQL